jgi:tetratricopeptide (TPR) repeat protein
MDQQHQNILGAASGLRKMGAVLSDLGQYENAIDRHAEALKLDEQMDNRYGIASDSGNPGAAHYQNGDYQKSLFWLKKAHACFVELNAMNGALEFQQLIKEISETTST